MSSILIKVTGFLGDILFSTSVARQFKREDRTLLIDYVIPLNAPYELLQLDNNIQEYKKAINMGKKLLCHMQYQR